jgi:predicted amidohydrolase YtcJ
MTRKKTYETTVSQEASAAMAQLLADGNNGEQFDFTNVDYAAIGRLVSECCRHGLLVSCYNSSSDHAFCISIRAGERKRSYQHYTANELNVSVGVLMKTLSGTVKTAK